MEDLPDDSLFTTVPEPPLPPPAPMTFEEFLEFAECKEVNDDRVSLWLRETGLDADAGVDRMLQVVRPLGLLYMCFPVDKVKLIVAEIEKETARGPLVFRPKRVHGVGEMASALKRCELLLSIGARPSSVGFPSFYPVSSLVHARHVPSGSSGVMGMSGFSGASGCSGASGPIEGFSGS